eukprot:g1233.t1
MTTPVPGTGRKLLRAILRAHRHLSPKQRELGDRYVKDEFRAHRNAKPEFIPVFISQWTEYLEMLKKQHAQRESGNLDHIGAHLSPDEVRGLNDEQREQLRKLEEATRNL